MDSDLPDFDDFHPDEYEGPTEEEIEEAFADLPQRESLEEGEPCPECGYEFDSDEWEVRHLTGGDTVGEDWIYTCPGCDQETCMIGT